MVNNRYAGPEHLPSFRHAVQGVYETAAASYGGNVDFLKTSLSSEGCLPVAEHHTLIIDVSAGCGSGTLPYQEQFEIRSADFLIGYPLPGYHRRGFVGANELGASATYRWMMTEHQLNAVKAAYLVLSGGAVNVWNARDDMSLQGIRKGASIGLHADTLTGPVRLDFVAGEDRMLLGGI